MPLHIQDTKKCKICNEEKSFGEFYPLKSGKYGIDSKCKICDINEGKKFRRTKKGLIFEIYRTIKKSIKNHDENLLHFSREDFYSWLDNKPSFINLYEIWENSDYIVDLKPACYKIDSDMPYTLDNLSIATSKQVKEKIAKDRKSGANHSFNTKISKPVNQYTKDGIFIKKHHSIQAAERYLQEINNDNRRYGTSITACKNGRAKSAHGYVWKEDITPIEKTKFGEKIDVKHLNNYLIEDIENILGSEISIDTEKENLIKCRIGQGKFRDQLIEYWKSCSITGFKNIDLLIASHIKPWRDSSDIERLDVYNGLLLTPNLDKLFDKGYISFKDNGEILISKDLTDYEALGVKKDMKTAISEQHKRYLEFHRTNIFEAYNKTLERNK